MHSILGSHAFSIPIGRTAILFPEGTIEIPDVIEANVQGDLQNLFIGMQQLTGSFGQSQIHQVFNRGIRRHLPEQFSKISRTHVCCGGKLWHSDRIRQIFIHIDNCLFHTLGRSGRALAMFWPSDGIC